MKILFNLQLVLSKEDVFNAAVKPREDINYFFAQKNYKVINKIIVSNRNPRLTMLRILCLYIYLGITSGFGNEWFFQYPMNGNFKWLPYILSIFRQRGNTVTLIIHDIESVRRKDDTYFQKELKIFNSVDCIFVHTQTMCDLLMERGVTCRMKIMHLFNYMTQDALAPVEYIVKRKNEVIFAGNLKKSLFIPSLLEMNTDVIRFKYYGVKPDFDMERRNHTYCGKFTPEKVSYIQGGWGLVWDGDGIDTCRGELGNYLRYNVSHKISLYLAAGLPVIVWKESGIADWVTCKKVGITIYSLSEIEEKIKQMSIEDYQSILVNVHQTAKDLRSGNFLYELL